VGGRGAEWKRKSPKKLEKITNRTHERGRDSKVWVPVEVAGRKWGKEDDLIVKGETQQQQGIKRRGRDNRDRRGEQNFDFQSRKTSGRFGVRVGVSRREPLERGS